MPEASPSRGAALPRSALRRLGALVSALAAAASALGAELGGLYTREPDLQTTMLAARGRLRDWGARQQQSRPTVSFGEWYVAEAPPRNEDAALPPVPHPLDVAAADSAGKRLWSERAEWKDGAVVTLSTRTTPGSGTSVVLTRSIRAHAATELTVGLGGGDRLAAWLDGERVVSCDTSLPYERYGTSLRLEGSRRDQVLVTLSLPVGESRLLVRLSQQAVHAHRPLQLYFTSVPDPVPRLWETIRRDFPPAANRLLSYVHADWFSPGGWMTARDTASFEQRLLRRAADESHSHGELFSRELERLLRNSIPADDRRWLDLCVNAAEFAVARKGLATLRTAVGELAREFPERFAGAECMEELDGLHGRLLQACAGRLDPSLPDGAALLGEIEHAKRDMLVTRNPLLRDLRLLFVKRHTYDSRHYYDDYYNGVRAFGGSLCVLHVGSGHVRDVAPQLEGGIFDRYDLSFDGRRIVFGYRPPRPEGYRIYETGVDGTGLRQLTFPPPDEDERVATYSYHSRATLAKDPLLYGHWTDDMHPCYLPDGRIAFVSSRCERSVLCGGHSLTTTCLYRVNADGSGLHQLSQGALSEFTPTVMSDGRLLYNRWEYVYKGIAAVQPLWAMRPDGSGSEEVYGDNIADPGVFVQARQVPGRDHMFVCAGVGHEPLGVGTILLLDLHKDKRTRDPMRWLTPDTDVKGLRGLYQKRNGVWRAHDVNGPFYCDPYPLHDPRTGGGAGSFFLVSCNPDRRYNDPSAYGIWLLDVFGNCVRVYNDSSTSCWQPMPLRPRPRPPVLPDGPSREQESPAEAILAVTDVYRGLEGVERGTVKYLRVMEQVPRPWSVHTHTNPGDAFPGQMVAISYYTHIWVAVLHGVVPVQEDGSAFFTVPANRNIYLQALDDDFMEVQKMRTFVNLQPGERRACIGCHEHRQQAPVSKRVAALQAPPDRPVAQPGETAPRPLHYPSDVQPVLDRHCVRCHAGEKPKGGLTLAGEPTEHFSQSYEQLIRKGLVSFIQEWTGPSLKNPPTYFTVGGAMSHAPSVPPYTYGSHRSKLMDVLRKGHHEVRLSREERVRLATWIDCNAPFYGSYFGRRNIRFAKHPGFRPEPTLASACGEPPEPVRPEPVPARLVARWGLDEGSGATAGDASGAGRAGRVVGAQWTDGPHASKALQFDGTGYVEVGDLGSFETMSVSLWIRVDALTNRWNPLLFCHDWDLNDFHFSLNDDGTVNVAINAGNPSGVHRRTRATVADGAWHHVAVVCDPRYGGVIRFYIDGVMDGEAELDIGLPLILDGMRMGGWNRWEKNPKNNFHGAMDDVRVFDGMLAPAEIAKLAGQG